MADSRQRASLGIGGQVDRRCGRRLDPGEERRQAGRVEQCEEPARHDRRRRQPLGDDAHRNRVPRRGSRDPAPCPTASMPPTSQTRSHDVRRSDDRAARRIERPQAALPRMPRLIVVPAAAPTASPTEHEGAEAERRSRRARSGCSMVASWSRKTVRQHERQPRSRSRRRRGRAPARGIRRGRRGSPSTSRTSTPGVDEVHGPPSLQPAEIRATRTGGAPLGRV